MSPQEPVQLTGHVFEQAASIKPDDVYLWLTSFYLLYHMVSLRFQRMLKPVWVCCECIHPHRGWKNAHASNSSHVFSGPTTSRSIYTMPYMCVVFKVTQCRLSQTRHRSPEKNPTDTSPIMPLCTCMYWKTEGSQWKHWKTVNLQSCASNLIPSVSQCLKKI